jgi:hypothetical protein
VFAVLVGNALLIFALCAIVFAFVSGGAAERWGAATILACNLLSWLSQAAFGSAPLTAFLLIDLTLVAGLGVITFRYPDKLWPGLAACAQTLVLAFSATRALHFPLSEVAYLTMLNVSSLVVALALAGGTWSSRWYRKPHDEWEEAAVRMGVS